MKKKFCFDIDGVICNTVGNDYLTSKPNLKTIKTINNLYFQGHYIILFTSRYMGRNKENVINAKKQGYNFTYKQLKKWGLSFDKLIFGKPSYDIYVDDKSIFFKKNWQDYLLKKYS
jgi:hydroxymethylpyrimidine pyrophosphatase-like HAD family hydrolase